MTRMTSPPGATLPAARHQVALATRKRYANVEQHCSRQFFMVVR